MDRELWAVIKNEIDLRVEAEPSLGSFLHSLILSQKDLLAAVASILASKLHSDALSAMDIKKGASIFASSTILGNITIGENAVVAAGSLVLKDVQRDTTVAGIPAKELNKLNITNDSWDPGNSGL